MDPFTIALIASTAIQGISTMNSARQQKKAAASAAEAARYNAAVKRKRAELTLQSYGQREQAFRKTSDIERGRRNAVMAQSGFGMGGSNADVERQYEIMAELDALNIRYEGELASSDLLDVADVEERTGQMIVDQSKSIMPAAYLMTAGQMMSGYASYQQSLKVR